LFIFIVDIANCALYCHSTNTKTQTGENVKTQKEIVEKLKKMNLAVLAEETGLDKRTLFRIRNGQSFTYETGLILIACLWD